MDRIDSYMFEKESKTLQNCMKMLDDVFDGLDGLPTSKCITGKPYTVVYSDGVKNEGESIGKYYETPNEAVGAWIRSITRWVSHKRGVLHWRERPQLVYIDDDFDNRGFIVYSRLTILEE